MGQSKHNSGDQSTELYLPVGIPLLGVYLFSAKFAAIDKRFDDMRDVGRAELRRVEEVVDARLKHIEERG